MIAPLDNYLLRAYLDGEMDEAAAEAFELLMIERPDLAELVIADVALGMGLRAEAASAAPEGAAAAEQPPVDAATVAPAPVSATPISARPSTITDATPPRSAETLAHRPRRRSFIPFAAAAGIALAVGLGLGRQWQPELPMLAATSRASVEVFRGSSAIEIRLPKQGPLVLSLPVFTEQCPSALVRISQAGRQWETQADAEDDYLYIIADAQRLEPGKAEVSLTCAGQPPQPFAVVFKR